MNEQTTPSPSSVGLRYGLITGFALIVFSLILYLTNLNENRWLALLGWGIVLVGIVFAYKAFKQDNHGFMSYGQGLGIGTILGAIAGLLAGIFAIIYTTYIDNTIMQKMMDKQIEEMESRGMSDEQIEKSMEIADMLSGPFTMGAVSVISYAFGAFLFSLIIAAIMKRTQPEFE